MLDGIVCLELDEYLVSPADEVRRHFVPAVATDQGGICVAALTNLDKVPTGKYLKL